MTPDLQSTIAELEGLLERATPGPWEWWSSCSHWRITGADGRDGGVLSAFKASDGFPCVSCAQEDRDLIVAAVNALPSLLSALKEKEGRRASTDSPAKEEPSEEVLKRAAEAFLRSWNGGSYTLRVGDAYAIKAMRAAFAVMKDIPRAVPQQSEGES